MINPEVMQLQWVITKKITKKMLKDALNFSHKNIHL